MPTETKERAASQSELDFMRTILQSSPSRTKRLKQSLENTIIVWAATMLTFMLLWFLFAIVVEKLLNIACGWKSPYAWSIALIGAVISATVALSSTTRWLKTVRDFSAPLQNDIEQKLVLEEHYVFTEAKRFQEPEHGGLIYFMLTEQSKVLVLYDEESQNLGAQGEDPLLSNFKVHTKLILVRAPNTRYVISKNFFGTKLEVGEPIELSIAPNSWPDSDEYCSISWEDLESRLCVRR